MNKAAGPGRGPGAFPALPEVPPALGTPAGHSVRRPDRSPAPQHRHHARADARPAADRPWCARLTAFYPIVPLASRQAPGVAMSTYHRVYVALHADPTAMPDLAWLAQHFGAALRALLAC
jgi:diacylglycerol O-acyltransferase